MDEKQPDDTTYTPPPGAPPGPSVGDRLLHELKSLRRSRNDRVIAGVCGGVARQLGLDPLLVRIVVAVLAVFGGGIVLYAAGWLLLPLDDGEPSLGQRVAGHQRGRASTSTVVLAAALVVAVCLGIGFAFSRWDGPFLLTLAVVGFVAWLLLRERRGEVPTAGPGASYAGYAPPPPVPMPPAGGPGSSAPSVPTGPTYPAAQSGAPYGAPAMATTAPVGVTTPGTPGGEAPTAALPGRGPDAPPAGSGPWTPPPPGGVPPTAAWPPPPVSPPPPPAPRRPRSVLFSATMSLVLVGLGTLKLIDLSGVHVNAGAYPALALTIIGAGLLIGTWFGRSRGLIVMGLLAALLTAGATAGDQWQDGPHGVNIRTTPTSLNAMPDSGRFSSGTVRYDLSALDFTGVSRTLDVSLGAGQITVIVPPDVDVRVTGSVGVGQLDLFGRHTGGLGNDETVTDLGADGVGGGSLDLHLQTGVGHVEVDRG